MFLLTCFVPYIFPIIAFAIVPSKSEFISRFRYMLLTTTISCEKINQTVIITVEFMVCLETFAEFSIIDFSNNQLVIALKSVWRSILANARLFLVLCRLLSPAQLLEKHCLRNKTMSFINKSNNSGPSIRLCRIPALTFFLN